MSLHSVVALSLWFAVGAEPKPTNIDGAFRREVTLQEAIGLAAKNNYDLASARAQAAQTAAQASRVFSAILPELTLSGSLVRTSNPAVFDVGGTVDLVAGVFQIPPVNTSIVPPPQVLQGRDTAMGTAQASQVIFTPLMFLIPAASRGSDAAKLGAQEAQEQILLGVARVYLGLQGLQQVAKAAKDAETVALKREKDASSQIAAGLAVEVALLRAQSETAQARATLAQLEGTQEGLLATLEAMVGEAIRPTDTWQETQVPTPTDESA